MMFVWITVVSAALTTATPSASPQEPAPQGSYQTDVLGVVDLGPERDRVVGVAVEGGVCPFAPRQRILEGELQGHLLVGQLTLCLLPADSCAEKQVDVPILAVINPEDRSLAAFVRPPKGCQLPVLGEGGMVVLQQTSRLEASQRPTAAAAALTRPSQRTVEGAKAALQRGNELLARKDWKGAIEALELSLYHLEGRVWREERLALAIYHALGTALVMDKQPTRAIEVLQRASAMNAGDPSLIYYNLACAHAQLQDKKKALYYYELAVARGLSLQGGGQERALDDLLGSDVKFATRYNQLTQQAFANFDKLAAGKRAPPPGP